MTTQTEFDEALQRAERGVQGAEAALRNLGGNHSPHEETFALAWRAMAKGKPQPEREYWFAPGRKWRFDFAWPEYKVAVEIDGGQWMPHGGRHSRDEDRWKLNSAAVMGWRVLRYSASMLGDPERVVEEVLAALGNSIARACAKIRHPHERVEESYRRRLRESGAALEVSDGGD